jgi:hypothetical protein
MTMSPRQKKLLIEREVVDRATLAQLLAPAA